MAARRGSIAMHPSCSAGLATPLHAFAFGETNHFTDLRATERILDAANTPLAAELQERPVDAELGAARQTRSAAPRPRRNSISREWKSLTPYVPSRHVYGRTGKEKPGCSMQGAIEPMNLQAVDSMSTD